MAISSAKKASCFWGLRPKKPLPSSIVLQQKSIFFIIQFLLMIYFFHEFEQICTPSIYVVIYFKYLLQICTKMNGFKYYFSKNFCVGAPSPFAKSFSRFFLWLCLRSLLIFWYFAASFRASPSTLDWRTWFALLLNKFLDPPVLVSVSVGKFLDLLPIYQ